MNLVLHHFRKDTQRLRAPLILWILLVAIQAITIGSGSAKAQDDMVYQTVYQIISFLIPLLQWIMLILIVPLLIHEEPLVGTTAFWSTRPISGKLLLVSKCLFIMLWLIFPPLVAELLVLMANHVIPADIVLAIPEIILEKIPSVLVMIALATLTPNFARFALVGAILYIAQIISSVGLYVFRLIAADGNEEIIETMTSAATLSREYVIGISVLTLIGGLLVTVYQFFTRDTKRSIALFAMFATALWFASNFWRPQPLKKDVSVSTLHDFNAEAIKVSLAGKLSVADVQSTRHNQPRQKEIRGELDIEGQNLKYDVRISSLDAHLFFGDNAHFTQKTKPNGFSRQWDSDRHWDAMDAALGGARVVNADSTKSHLDLMLLSEDDYNRHLNETGRYSADVTMDVYDYRIAAEFPLIKGARYEKDSERVVISDILNRPSGVSVVIRESKANLLLKRDALLDAPEFDRTQPKKVYYLLYHKEKGEAFLPDDNSFDMNEIFSRDRARFSAKNTRLDFTGSVDEHRRRLPDIDKEWLNGAVLLRVETLDYGKFTTKLEIADFSLIPTLKTSRLINEKKEINHEELDKITLPDNPAREDVTKYIQHILDVSEGQASWSGKDPQVDMLVKVGSAHVDLLLPHCDEHYVRYAIDRLAGPEHKNLVLQHLAGCYELADIVVQQGWVSDAKATLVQELKKKPDYLPDSWIRATAMLEDTATYDDLKEYFIRCLNKERIHNIIKQLPGIDLSDAVAKAWKSCKYSDEWMVRETAQIAIQYGHLDAFETLADLLKSGDLDERQCKELTHALKKNSEAHGTDQEIVSWYENNRDRIQFDHSTKKFIIADTNH